jgi:hypothetical protein
MLACHVLGLPDNDLRVARGERKQEQNRLVGILSIAASSPFPPKNLGRETVIYHIPTVPSSYVQATVTGAEKTTLFKSGFECRQLQQCSTVHQVPVCNVNTPRTNCRNILNVLVDAVIFL